MWRGQVLVNLRNAGPYSQHAAQYLVDNDVQLGFRRQSGSGAMWWVDGNIYLDADSYSLQSRPDDPYMLSLVAHEAKHLEQGALVALSVYGELEAWQLQHEVYKELLNDPRASLGPHWNQLSALPPNFSRSNLEQARELMRKAAPGYRIDLLPLYPAHVEFGYWYWYTIAHGPYGPLGYQPSTLP